MIFKVNFITYSLFITFLLIKFILVNGIFESFKMKTNSLPICLKMIQIYIYIYIFGTITA